MDPPCYLFLFFFFLKNKIRESWKRIDLLSLSSKKKNSPFRLDGLRLGQDVGRKAKRPTDIISDPLDCTGLQHLGLEQGASQGWGGLPRGSLPPHCLPPPPGHHSHTHPPAAGASAFNPFHHSIEQRSPRLPGPNSGENCIRHSYAEHPTYHPRIFFSSFLFFSFSHIKIDIYISDISTKLDLERDGNRSSVTVSRNI